MLDYEWMVGLKPETTERVERLLEDAPTALPAFNRVPLPLAPYAGPFTPPRGYSVTMRQVVPTRGGPEMLQWTLEQMVRDLMEAKAKAWKEEPTDA